MKIKNINSSIYKDYTFLILIQGLNLLFPFFLFPYLINTLGNDSFGVFIYAQSVLSILLIFVEFGFNFSATKYITIHQNNKALISNYYFDISMIKLLTACLGTILIFIFYHFQPELNQYKKAVFLAIIGVFGNVFFSQYIFQGLNLLKQFSVINIASKLLILPLVFLFVKETKDIEQATILHALVTILAGLLSNIYLRKQIDFSLIQYYKLNFNRYYVLLKESFAFFLSNSAISLYTSCIPIFLGYYLSSHDIGVFGTIDKLVRMICFGVYSPLVQVLFPFMISKNIENKNLAKNWFKKTFVVMLMLMSFMYICVYFTEFWINRYLVDYSGFRNLFYFSLLGIFPIALGGVCGQLGLVALGGELEKKNFRNVYVFAGIISIIITYFGVCFYKLTGGLVSVFLSEILVFIGMFYYLKKSKIV
jgi:polysaccharide transporter, PST family